MLKNNSITLGNNKAKYVPNIIDKQQSNAKNGGLIGGS
ncbi:MAG: hypothetical protein ACI9U0_000662 [Flavobacteriales bacterium]|jgi:hypothetical protein